MAKLTNVNSYKLVGAGGTASVNTTTTIFTHGVVDFPCSRINSMYITNNDSSNIIKIKVMYSDKNNSYADRTIFCAILHPNETVCAFSKEWPVVIDRSESLKIQCAAVLGTSDVDFWYSMEEFKNAL